MAAGATPTGFFTLDDTLGYGAPAPAGWQPLTDLPLHILVGMTGVGKTTTLQALGDAGIALRLLPNRRLLTDVLIINPLQHAEGQTRSPVTERGVRFEYTRRYRKEFEGGMAHALARLAVAPSTSAMPLYFDGLRGVNEVTYAAQAFPTAIFIVLHAPLVLRIERIAGRRDQFDQVAPADEIATLAGLLETKSDLLSAAERDRLYTGALNGTLDGAALHAALQIAQAESQNYAPEQTRQTLRSLCPERVIEIDTENRSPSQAAAQIAARARG